MIHLLTAAAVIAAAVIAGLTYRVAGKVVAWRLPRSALAGLAAAAALTIWVATVRHAALVHSAAQPMSDGQQALPRRHLGRRVRRHVHRGHRGRVHHLRRGRRASAAAAPPRQDSAPAGRRPPDGRPGVG